MKGNRTNHETQSVSIELPDGRKFPSMNAAARHLGICASTLYHHIENGTLDKVGKVKGPKNNCRPVEVNGRWFPSKTVAMSELRVSREKLERLLE